MFTLSVRLDKNLGTILQRSNETHPEFDGPETRAAQWNAVYLCRDVILYHVVERDITRSEGKG